MAKLTLTDVSAGYLSVATYNANNTLIEAALENTLSRDGTAPNTMSANLDLNSNKAVNLTDGTNAQDAVTKAQLDASVATPEGTAVKSTGVTDGYVLTADGANASAWEAIPVQVHEGTAIVSTGVTDGYVLTADGANASGWEAIPAPAGTAVTAVGVTDGYVLTADGANAAVWEAVPSGGAPEGTSVLSTGPVTDGYVLTADGAGAAAWEAATGGATSLTGLSDVSTAAVTNRFALMANGSAYVGRALVEADISDLGTYLTVTELSGDTTPVLGGDLASGGNAINMADANINRPVLKDYGLTSTTPTSTAGAMTVDLSLGNAFQHTLDENVTTMTISNPSASGTYCEFSIKFIQNGTGNFTVAWPGSVKWPGGTAPVITTTATTGTDICFLKTWDAGTTWYGDASQDYS